MNPFRLAEKVVDDYQRYIATTFPVADLNLLNQIKQLILEKGLLYKGPFITLARPPKREKTLFQLAERGIIQKDTADIFRRLIGENPLYLHQEETLKAAMKGESVLLTTGTGTGKTEAFLLPIVDYIIRKREEGCITLLVYPMNALINDQMERLRKLLKGTGITFARYTRETGENPPQIRGDAPDEEVLSRTEIRTSPPNLLLTNYVMLELMLVRREDRPIFKHQNLKFLVMDEVHAYRGSQGAEVAGLLRRVREHTGTVDKSKLVCIGTSATVASGKGEEALSFISKFFGSEVDKIVSETYDSWPQPDSDFPNPPLLRKEELEVFRPIPLAKKLLEKDISDIEELGKVLDKNPVIHFLRTSLEEPKSLEELGEKFRKITQRRSISEKEALLELTAYLLLGVEAKDKDGQSLLRPKLHIFAKGLENIQLCSNCRKILIHGEDLCPDCKRLVFPLTLCRNCGQDFLMASDQGDILIPPDNQRPEGKTYILQHLAEAQDEEVESRLTNWREAAFCPQHGGLFFTEELINKAHEKSCPECGKDQKLISIRIYPDKIMTCPACGGTYRPQPVVTALRSQVASQVAVLTTTLLTHLEPEFRRLLVFSDNRQDTAFQASITEKRYRNIAVASSVHRILKEGEEDLHEDGLPKKVAKKLLDLGVENPDEYRTEPSRKRLNTQVMREVINLLSRAPKRMGIVEDLGIARFEYAELETRLKKYLNDILSSILLPEEKILNLMIGLLDVMRISGSIWYTEIFDEEMRRDIIGWGYDAQEARIQGREVYFKMKRFVSERAYTSLSDYIRRALKNDLNRNEINKIVLDLVSVLKKEGYLITKEIPLRRGRVRADFINHELILLKTSEGGWQCSACKRYHSKELLACTKWQCKGELRYQNIESDNYYINYFKNYDPVGVKAQEHSGQLDGLEREDIEKKFKDGRINTIVCTPTMELGIDIGDLQSIVMRNLPPSPSNYAQSSGRAGRRERIALILAHATSRP
ncbi:MAG: DEAD/DEAH box helicase, partial [Candidatus Hodarchaeota archaeon]